MAHIVGDSGHVVTLDIDADLVAGAREQLAAGFERVHVVCGDGGLGYPAGAPYERIILTGEPGMVYPRETHDVASTNESVVVKRWTQLVLDWPIPQSDV